MADPELAGTGPSEEASPEELAGSFSRLIFSWVWPFCSRAWAEIAAKGTLDLGTLPPLPAGERPEEVISQLGTLVHAEMQAKKPSLQRVMWRWHRTDVIQLSIFGILYTATTLAPPLFLRPLVRSLQGEIPQIWAYLSVVGMAVAGLISVLVQQHSWHRFNLMGRKIWLGCVGHLCKKPAQLDAASFSKSFTEAQVISMIGQDAPLFPHQFPFMFVFVPAPMLILTGGTLVFVILKEAFLAGAAVCVVLSVLAERAAHYYKSAVARKFKLADERMLILNEAMQGMRYVKLCAWEAAIEARVEAVRRKEMRAVRWSHTFFALQMGLAAAIPVASILATFLTHAALGRQFDAGTVLLALGCFEIMAGGFLILPNAFMYFKTFGLALSRMGRLIMAEDSYIKIAKGTASEGVAVSDGCFQWDPAAQEPILSNISFAANRGQVVAVVGRVASGKSTLAAAVFGLCKRVRGGVDLGGRCAYVPQNPQILNASVRENVLFGTAFDEERYQRSLQRCCLTPDLEQLSERDLTEIGEKGITISGGQRARVAMARALFSEPDVVVLDDPLSAMDAHVGRKVFEECVLKGLRDAGCAVLFLTNQLQFCQAADKILVLGDGHVVEEGTFAELQGAGGAFASMFASTKAAQLESSDEKQEQAPPRGEQEVQPQAPAPTKPQPGSTGRTAMKQETLIQGRIGLKEFMRITYTGKSALLGCVLTVFSVAAPLFMYATNIALTRWVDVGAMAPMKHRMEIVLYCVAGGLYILCTAGRCFTAALFFSRVSQRLHGLMVSAVLRQQMSWYDTTPVGRVLNRCSQDTSNMDIMIPRYFEFCMQHGGGTLVGFLGAAILVWPSLFVIVPILFAFRLIYNRYATLALDLQRLNLTYTSPLLSRVSSFLTALDTIRAFDKEAFFTSACRSTMADVNRTFYWAHNLDRVVMLGLTLLCVPTLMLLVGFGTVLLSQTGLVDGRLGGLAMALTCGIAFRLPLWMWTAVTSEKFLGGTQRVCEYAELPMEGDARDRAAWLASPKVVEEWPVKGNLEIEDVSLRYQPGLPLVLNGLNLKVEAGQRLGVCGRTGSGKSTLFLACFRLVAPESGRVLLDGKESRDVPLPTWRSRLAIVPQDPLMFSGSLRFNLDIHGQHAEEKLWEALRLTCLEEQVRKLEGGLDEPVQEMGGNFSAGTVQLLSIARVLLGSGSAGVVFLDECTASVDYETDALVQTAVRRAFAGRSVVCIAHRVQTIMDYDRIAFLQGGKVAEYGSPKELLARQGGHFAGLAQGTHAR